MQTICALDLIKQVTTFNFINYFRVYTMSKNTTNSASQCFDGPDYNGTDFQIHDHVVGDSLDDFANKLQGKYIFQILFSYKCNRNNQIFIELLVSTKVHDKFDCSHVFLCLQAAHGRREFMNALELGRAQGFVTAWTKIR